MTKITTPSVHGELEAYLRHIGQAVGNGADLGKAADYAERRGVAELVANLDDPGDVSRLARVAMAAFEEHKAARK